ncbi:MAG: NAD+ synthase [Candidatus Delongbacteria bacterium]|nr:NAD+ synthase [Candidatus Delongbacteria bacterium]
MDRHEGLSIAMVQANPILGNGPYNMELLKRMTERVSEWKPDIVVFPEMFLTGYPPEDLLLVPAFRQAFSRMAQQDVPARFPNGIGLVGGIDQRDEGLYNAAFIYRNGIMSGVVHKHKLPNYGVFDEFRYFRPGRDMGWLECKGYRILVTICEDIWPPYEQLEAVITEHHPDGIINMSASPFDAGKPGRREALFSGLCRRNSVWLAYCNLVGGQDELVFDGRSLFIDPAGQIVYRGAAFQSETALITFTGSGDYRTSVTHPQWSEEEEIYEALTLGLKDYIEKNGFQSVVLGLSGGIDSAVTAAIAVDAIGKERVRALALPGPYSSPGSLADARQLADNLGIQMDVVDINPLYQAYVQTLNPIMGDRPPDITEENLQARIRGNLLMAFSNKFNSLLLTTGNKSEVSTGYCTLYGDMAGGFAVIKDVLKTMVYRISIWRNRRAGFDLIPESTLTKPPSAELKPDQKDSDSLPDYEILDRIIHAYVELDSSREELLAQGFEPGIIDRIIRLIQQSEYKRRQAAPGIKITQRAFGKDRRYPITHHWRT